LSPKGFVSATPPYLVHRLFSIPFLAFINLLSGR
jgi:hypothetical protein